MSLGRSYTTVPQNPLAGYRYGDGNYPPQQNHGDGNYTPNNGYPQASSHSQSIGQNIYDDPEDMDPNDDVFQPGYHPVPKPRNHSRTNTLEMEYAPYDMVDVSADPDYMADQGYEQPSRSGTMDSGVLAPEPVRPIKSKKKRATNQLEQPETDAEKARRERKERKKRQKELQENNNGE